MNIESRLITLRDIAEGNLRFTIPIYQRLYVWGLEQVKTLLEDLLTAFNDNREQLFLGTTLVIERNATVGAGKVLELIDGQQRFTTLWLISLVWQMELKSFLHVSDGKTSRPRLSFDIRDSVNRFFQDQTMPSTDAGFVGDGKGMLAISAAQAQIRSFKDSCPPHFDHRSFTAFICDQVHLVLTRVPAKTDLNKLFEVINSRGIQLQHHEILKARMLSMLNVEERGHYALLWDACSGMNNYVERNLLELAGDQIKIAELFDNEASTSDEEALSKAISVLAALVTPKDAPPEACMTLANILDPLANIGTMTTTGRPKEESESDVVRSIIGFPLFLLHVLRVWLHKHNKVDLFRSIQDKELLSLFADRFPLKDEEKELSRANVRSFIELLWELRYLFDKHIIKRVSEGEQSPHLIRKLRVDEGSLRRETEEHAGIRSFSLLQSMLYHSQQITTQYWLTPLFAYMHKHPGNPNDYVLFLRNLDNHLHCTEETGTLAERSWAFLEQPWKQSKLDCSVLNGSLGTGFPHYWFYKLEYVLWLDGQPAPDFSVGWKAFRFTAKNSVEHISPQNAQEVDTNTIDDELMRDGFGNLALVSRSINSEYGNRPFNEKREQFWNRNQKRLDSLKMALIYKNIKWSDELAKMHGKEMINLIQNYFISTTNACSTALGKLNDGGDVISGRSVR